MTRPSNLPPGCTDTDIERDAGQADTCADFPSRDEFHHINDLAARIAPGIVWDIGRHGIWSNDEVARIRRAGDRDLPGILAPDSRRVERHRAEKIGAFCPASCGAFFIRRSGERAAPLPVR